MKKRLAELLIERGFAASLKEVEALCLTGDVLVDDIPVTSPAVLLSAHAVIRLRKESQRYVSRGGFKLEAALQHFHLEVRGKVCLDLGASTGGFTDCLLQHGASKVIAVDVGYGQLAMKLQRDSRVVMCDRTNVKTLTPELLGEEVDLVTIDLSFISTSKILSLIPHFLHSKAHVVVLVKPQFELAAEKVEEGGVVRSEAARREARERVIKAGEALGWKKFGEIASPILGAKGNQEYLVAFSV